MSHFSARYNGRCGNCDEPFQAGDEVFYDENDTLTGQACCGESLRCRCAARSAEPVPADRVVPRGKTPRDKCGVCFQIPASNGVCGCS